MTRIIFGILSFLIAGRLSAQDLRFSTAFDDIPVQPEYAKQTAFLQLAAALNEYERADLAASINRLREINESVPSAQAYADLLTALIRLEHNDPASVRRASELLESIDDSSLSLHPALVIERQFWLAETYRLMRRYAKANELYAALVKQNELPSRDIVHLRYAESLERVGDLRDAARQLDAVASRKYRSHLALEASFSRLGILLAQGDLYGADEEIERAEELARQKIRPFPDNMYSSSVYNERTPSQPDTFQYSSAYHLPMRMFFRALILSARRQYSEAIAVFDSTAFQTERIKAVTQYDTDSRDFLRLASRYERASALFEKGDYGIAADEFAAIERSAPSIRAGSTSIRENGSFGDYFFADETKPSSSGIRLRESNGSRYYVSDIPARARYYAAIAMARSGRTDDARLRLTDLSQDASALYSDKASYHLALVEFRSGRTYQAEALLKPLVMKRTQTSVYATVLLADILYRRSSFARANELLTFALDELSPRDSIIIRYARLLRGMCAIGLGSWKQSARDLETYINSAISVNSSFAIDEALYQYGWACLRSDSTRNAAACFQRILRENPTSQRAIDAQYGYAWTLFKEERYDEADKAFARILQMDSISRYAYDLLARMGDGRYAKGEYRKALRIYNLAVDRPSFNKYLISRAMYQLGLARMRSDSARSAMNAFNYIAVKLPQSDLVPASYYNYALAAYAIVQNQKAEESIASLVKLHPSSPLASKGLFLAATQAERSGDDQKALTYYKRILKEYPAADEWSDALYSALDGLIARKKFNDAIALANQYIRSDAKPELLMKKGVLLLQAGKYQDALDIFDICIASTADNSLRGLAVFYSAKAFGALGQTAKSTTLYNQVIDSFAATDAASFAYLELARIDRKAGRNENAAELYRMAYDMRYYSSDAAPQAMTEYADFLRSVMKQPDEAVAVYDEITRRYMIETSAGSDAQFDAAEIMIALGKRADAVTRWERIASARKGEEAASEAYLKLGDHYRRSGQSKNAVNAYENVEAAGFPTSDQLGRSLLGIAELRLAAGDKKTAKNTAVRIVRTKTLPFYIRSKAQHIIEELTPKKPVKKKR